MGQNITWCFLSVVFFLLSIGQGEAQEKANIRYTVDKELPKVYCINGLAINFTKEDQSKTISAREVNLGSIDNIGIKTLKLEKHQPNATVPTDNAKDEIEFTRKDLGKHKIDLWVGDFGGNWARKSTYVLVSDLTLEKVESRVDYVNNYPNPFTDRTQISFEMLKAGFATISVLDSEGDLIKEIKAVYPQGKQVVEIKKSDLPTVGVYYYRVMTDQGSITKNMIMVNY